MFDEAGQADMSIRENRIKKRREMLALLPRTLTDLFDRGYRRSYVKAQVRAGFARERETRKTDWTRWQMLERTEAGEQMVQGTWKAKPRVKRQREGGGA